MPWLKRLIISALAPSMRSPSGISGWFARRIMRTVNPESTRFAIRHRLHLQSSDVFVELGAGEGVGIKAVVEGNNIPSHIHLVEISDSFRGELTRVVNEEILLSSDDAATNTKIEIHGEDCRSMPYLADNSVDKIFAMNVVYFLDPLPEYLKEIYRVLKPGGVVVWGCKFFATPKDSPVFVNVEEDKVTQMMQDAGFVVSSEMIDVGNNSNSNQCANNGDEKTKDDGEKTSDMRNYLELKGEKKK